MIRIQTVVKFSLLRITQGNFFRHLCDGVPDVLDELDAFGNAQAQYV